MKPRRHKSHRNALELIEEAVHLLRTAPLKAWTAYYLGALPFILGLMYFWADMSRNPFAHRRLAAAALGMALLFVWMKFWQVVFARQLRASLSAETPANWSPRRCARVLVNQTIFQTTGLFLVPLSAFPIIPSLWVYGFFQNVTTLDDGETTGVGTLLRRAARQSALWTGQYCVTLLLLAAFGFCVFLNWSTFCVLLPMLVKMFSGVESTFTRSSMGMLNTTFFFAMLGLTYLSVDPIVKAVHVLRCFYGESLTTGNDLKAELKNLSSQIKPLAAAALLLMSFTTGVSAQATDTAPAPKPASAERSLSSSDLDRAINQTIQQKKYTWRAPREEILDDESEEGVVARFLRRASEMLRDVVRKVGEWLKRIFQSKPPVSSGGSSGNWMVFQQVLLYALAAVSIIALVVLLVRVLLNRRKPAPPVQTEALQPLPDVADENVGAEQLPEDGWTRLGRELLERGEYRLAIRAFYLAVLAHLAARNLISLARFKSNRDYERELSRRGHSFPGLLATFGEIIPAFDRIWYGTHETNRELALQFAASVEKIKAGG